MHNTDHFQFLDAKNFIIEIKKLNFAPAVSLTKIPSFKTNQITSEYIIDLDFNNPFQIFEDEDLIKIISAFQDYKHLQALKMKIKASYISSFVSKALNTLLLKYNNELKYMDLDFSMTHTYKNISPRVFFCEWKSLKCLQTVKISFENNILEESDFDFFFKEIQSLELKEFELNLNHTNISNSFLIKLSNSLKSITSLKKLAIFSRNNKIAFPKNDLTSIFKNLSNLKSLNSLELDFKGNGIHFINIVYILRKCLKIKIFPLLEVFSLNANHMKLIENNQTKLIYYLQRKAASFRKELSVHPLKIFSLKIKKNIINDETLFLMLGFFQNMKNLMSFTLLLKENLVSFAPYLKFLFQININTLFLDYYQNNNESFPISLQTIPKPLVKKLVFKGHFTGRKTFEQLTKYLKNLINLEDFEMEITCDNTQSFEKKWAPLMEKSFTSLKNIKLNIVSRDNGMNFVCVKAFFMFFLTLKTIEKIALVLSIQPNLNLNDFLANFAENTHKLKFLNSFSYKFVSLNKIPMDGKTRKIMGKSFLNKLRISFVKTEDEYLNKIFRQKYRSLQIAWNLSRKLRSTFKRNFIIEEILFYFINIK